MPTNVYFDTGTRPEQNLYEDLIIEQLRIYGQDVYYIPRKLLGTDNVFGEDTSSKFEDAYLIEMYMDTIDGYEGEKELMSKFGLDIQNDTTFTVARRRWEQFVAVDNNLIESSRPNEGDLVFWPKGNRLFEITFVDHDDPFYQVHNLPTYKLKCKTFEYGSETIDTGITELDSVQADNSLDMLSHQMTLEAYSDVAQLGTPTLSSGTLLDIPLLYGGGGYTTPPAITISAPDNISGIQATAYAVRSSATGAITSIVISNAGSGYTQTPTVTIGLPDVAVEGSIILENNVDGAEASYIILETYVVDTIDENAQNDIFEWEDDDVLDFSEHNPFGDAGMN